MCVYIKQTKQSPLSKLQYIFNESILVGPTVFLYNRKPLINYIGM